MEPHSSVSIVTRPQAGQLGFDSRFFLLATASRLALGPAQPPIQWILGAVSPGVKWFECKADHSLYLVPRLKRQ